MTKTCRCCSKEWPTEKSRKLHEKALGRKALGLLKKDKGERKIQRMSLLDPFFDFVVSAEAFGREM